MNGNCECPIRATLQKRRAVLRKHQQQRKRGEFKRECIDLLDGAYITY